MANKRALIVIPTYNEKDNLPILIDRIFKIDLSAHITELHLLVVDDNSPDGTADLVRSLQSDDPRIHLLSRPEKQGLGKAYVAGFDYALQNGYDYIFEMDADLSHDPAYLPEFLNRIQHCDLVIGSRYVKGVNVINWPLSRLLISYFGNKYARWVTGMPIQDATAGYKCFKRETLQAIDLTRVSASGYSFQIEMNYRAWILKFKICEIPIIFYDRTIGASKMSTNIIREGFLLVWKLKIKNLFGKL
ncbi:polyprenol monophosphomannose synthase [bacterium]|nr:polyprenol monophosphomannose synthase [bacterium]